jgi:hypothetical protein
LPSYKFLQVSQMNAGSAQWTHDKHYRPPQIDYEVRRNEKHWEQCASSTWLTVCAFLGAVSGCSSPRYCSQAPYMFLWIGLNKSSEKSSDIRKDK